MQPKSVHDFYLASVNQTDPNFNSEMDMCAYFCFLVRLLQLTFMLCSGQNDPVKSRSVEENTPYLSVEQQ